MKRRKSVKLLKTIEETTNLIESRFKSTQNDPTNIITPDPNEYWLLSM